MKHLNRNLFFFIDVLKEYENYFLKTDHFFKKNDLFSSNKFFIPFSFEDKKNLFLLEKNENFISFFFFIDRLFFKNQLKILKIFISNEFFNSLFKKKNIISIFIFFFYYKFLFSFIFILKNFSLLRKKNG